MHFPLLQGEFKRGGLIGGQLHAVARLSLVANSPDSQLILTGRQVRDQVLSCFTGKDTDGDLCFRISSLHKCSLERRTVGAFDSTGDLRSASERRNAENYNDRCGNSSQQLHCLCPPFRSTWYFWNLHPTNGQFHSQIPAAP